MNLKQLFKPELPTADQLAKRELEDSERELLRHESQAAYHRHMADYYVENIARLRGRNASARLAATLKPVAKKAA
jgi:hypothetical protein